MEQKFKQVKGFLFSFFFPPFSQLEPELSYILSGFICLFLVSGLTKNTSVNPAEVFSALSSWDAPLAIATQIAKSFVLKHSGAHMLSRMQSCCSKQEKSPRCLGQKNPRTMWSFNSYTSLIRQVMKGESWLPPLGWSAFGGNSQGKCYIWKIVLRSIGQLG